MVRFGTKRVETSPPFSIVEYFIRNFISNKKPQRLHVAAFTILITLLFMLVVIFSNFGPIHNIKKGSDIVWSAILIIQIIRVFPYI